VVHVVLAPDAEDALPGMTVGVRVQDAALDVEDDVLEPNAALFSRFAFFASSQAKYFTTCRIARRCPEGTHWHRLSVPKSVPKRGPQTIIRQPTPTKKANKKRA
jgi:hypothetical protein